MHRLQQLNVCLASFERKRYLILAWKVLHAYSGQFLRIITFDFMITIDAGIIRINVSMFTTVSNLLDAIVMAYLERVPCFRLSFWCSISLFEGAQIMIHVVRFSAYKRLFFRPGACFPFNIMGWLRLRYGKLLHPLFIWNVFTHPFPDFNDCVIAWMRNYTYLLYECFICS